MVRRADAVTPTQVARRRPARHQVGASFHPGKGPASIVQPVEDFGARTARRFVSVFSLVTRAGWDSECSGGCASSGNGQSRSVPSPLSWEPPSYLRTPSRHSHDLTLFKNFGLGGDRRLQFRVGAFNVFNQAWPTYNLGFNDLDLTLDTRCNVRHQGVPNGAGGVVDVCDPRGGFTFTEQTTNNFGSIVSKRGRRILELAVKFYF